MRLVNIQQQGMEKLKFMKVGNLVRPRRTFGRKRGAVHSSVSLFGLTRLLVVNGVRVEAERGVGNVGCRRQEVERTHEPTGPSGVRNGGRVSDRFNSPPEALAVAFAGENEVMAVRPHFEFQIFVRLALDEELHDFKVPQSVKIQTSFSVRLVRRFVRQVVTDGCRCMRLRIRVERRVYRYDQTRFSNTFGGIKIQRNGHRNAVLRIQTSTVPLGFDYNSTVHST